MRTKKTVQKAKKGKEDETANKSCARQMSLNESVNGLKTEIQENLKAIQSCTRQMSLLCEIIHEELSNLRNEIKDSINGLKIEIQENLKGKVILPSIEVKEEKESIVPDIVAEKTL